MTNTAAKARTKTEMRRVAQLARRYGHYRPSPMALEAYVFCPQCQHQVTGYLTVDLTTFRRKTVTRALDEAMLEHLPYCEE